MKAVQFLEHGSADVLHLADRDTPACGPNQVLVQIQAAGLNHLDLWIRRGLPGLKVPLPHVPGSDGAGVIVERGSQIKDWQVGDEVVIQPNTFCGTCPACQQGNEHQCPKHGILGETQAGVQQEVVAMNPENIGPKPVRLSMTEAGAFALSALTSWQMLKSRAQLRRDENILILGGGSGVGSMAIQMARYLGARVIATAGSDEKRQLCYSLGADEVLDQHAPGFSKQVKALSPGGVDVVFEHIGEAVWDEAVRSLAVGGRLVTCGATTGYHGSLNLQHLFYKRLSILGSTMGSVSDFHECLHLAEQGALTPVIDRSFPFRAAADAHRYLDETHAFGKVVLDDWN